MKLFYNYLREFWKADFQPRYYASVAIFLAISFWVNYGLGGKVALKSYGFANHNLKGFLAYALFFALPYLVTIALYSYFSKDTKWAKQPEFWLKWLAAAAISTILAAVRIEGSLVAHIESDPDRIFFYRCLFLVKYHVVALLFVGTFYYLKDRDKPFLYGVTLQNFHWKSYLPIVGVALLGVIIAAFQPHFTEYYPICHPKLLQRLTLLSPLTAAALFETVYGGSFFWVEAIFRGLLVVGMGQILGKNAVVPMVAAYCFIHLPKPMGEAMSSILGGYLLGILAYRTQNIVGGIWLHITIALGMEFAAMIAIRT